MASALMLSLSLVNHPVASAGKQSSHLALPSDNPPLPDPHTGLLTPQDPIGAPVLGFIDEHFLTYIDLNQALASNHVRLDSYDSACKYYRAIGAVEDCSPFGDLVKPKFNFKQWKNQVQIDTASGDTDVAHFINQVDLNLTRDHHMVSHGPNNLAAYVCNHLPPPPSATDPTGYFPSQHEIDAAIRDIKLKTKPIIACVAMEFSPPVNAPTDPPFAKFYIFGPEPEGVLLSAVDLDGRGPKAVPNVCTACHGGDFAYLNEAGQFDPTNKSLTPEPAARAAKGDLGAHFLPFDMANFAFSSKQTKTHREDAIFALNADVYNTELTRVATSAGSTSIVNLIKGWYGDVTKSNASPSFNTAFLADAWNDNNGPRSQAYLNTVSHSCRTCHVAMDNRALELSPALVKGSGYAEFEGDLRQVLVHKRSEGGISTTLTARGRAAALLSVATLRKAMQRTMTSVASRG